MNYTLCNPHPILFSSKTPSIAFKYGAIEHFQQLEKTEAEAIKIYSNIKITGIITDNEIQ